ncbi:MAG: hypothetical protein JWM85_3259 [Acidimicrobiaceae bacterium]|nr:hypothetical protein [Acidimicrobiaceae bacterium]
MATGTRCRRCGGGLAPANAYYCARCGTYQGEAPRDVDPNRTPRPPAWYRDPFALTAFRYLDGVTWTDHSHPAVALRQPVCLPVVAADRRSREEGPTCDGTWAATPGSLLFTLLGLAVAFAESLLAVVVFHLLKKPGGLPVELVFSEVGLWSGLFSTCVLASRRFGAGDMRTDFGLTLRWRDLGLGAVGALVGRCVAAAALIPILLFHRISTNPDRVLYSARTLGAGGWTVLIVITCIGAPFFEELFFRGLLQGQLVARFGPWMAIPVTAVVFGAAHISNDPGVGGLLLALSVGAAGVVLGVTRLLSGRLGASMAAHSLFNATALALLAALGVIR